MKIALEAMSLPDILSPFLRPKIHNIDEMTADLGKPYRKKDIF